MACFRSREAGTDIVARVNGVQATGKGLQASINTATLELSFTANSALTDGSSFSFSITGGGANFQLGPSVVSNQQARLGIQGISSATLGGVSGSLFELRSGGAKDLKTDVNGAAKVLSEVITAGHQPPRSTGCLPENHSGNQHQQPERYAGEFDRRSKLDPRCRFRRGKR